MDVLHEFEERIAKLPTQAHRLVGSNLVATTRDYEDHTFSGIIFVVEVQDSLPIDFVEIHSISVRGRLGRMSVYSTLQVESTKLLDPNGTFAQKLLRNNVGQSRKWKRNFGPTMINNHDPTMMRELVLDVPIRLGSGMAIAIYVHSEARGDEALVYDDQRKCLCHVYIQLTLNLKKVDLSLHFKIKR